MAKKAKKKAKRAMRSGSLKGTPVARSPKTIKKKAKKSKKKK